MTTATSQFVLRRWPQTDDELYWWVQAVWGIRIPRTTVCMGHKAPFQAFADAFFGRAPVTVWKASRGFGGKTRILSALSLTEAVILGAEVSLLGGSGAQSLNVHAASQEMWHAPHAPKQLWKTDPTKYDTHLLNMGYIRSLMASQTSVRGPHPQRLRLDEIDEMELEILEAAQGQPMRKRGIETQTVMSSTHQHPDGTMTHILKRAAELHWPVYEWCYKESSNPVDGWLTSDEVDRKRQEIPTHMWETEYDLQEPNFEGRAIDTAKVEKCFDPTLGIFDGKTPVLIQEPIAKVEYITGIDWAKEQDKTIVATFRTDMLPWVCVAWQQMNRMPWPVMIQKALRQWKAYGGTLVHAATGIGNVIDDTIRAELPASARNMVKPIVMGGGRARADLFTEYISGIESEEIRYPRIDYPYSEHKYAIVDDLYGRGHPPDSVVAGAMAWHARKHRVPKFVLPVGGTRASAWTL
jgi:hypothetical protein